jgi:hypothetical protein
VLVPAPTGQLLAQASESFVVQVDDGEEATYQSERIPVADVETAFSTTDFTLQPDGIPLNVERICQWTWMCSIVDIHPNTQGYGVIAQAVEQVLPQAAGKGRAFRLSVAPIPRSGVCARENRGSSSAAASSSLPGMRCPYRFERDRHGGGACIALDVRHDARHRQSSRRRE